MWAGGLSSAHHRMFIIKEAQRGSTELEAYRNLMEILGIEFPMGEKEKAE